MHDQIQRFYFTHSGIRGHWVGLNSVLTELQQRRAYPNLVSSLLGEMLAAVAMVADGLKWPGNIALQAKLAGQQAGDVSTLVAEFRPPQGLRAIARAVAGSFDDHELMATSHREILSAGQLAVSLLVSEDQPNAQPYQGLIQLSDGNLASNLENYFANSEQVPTLFRLASNGNQAAGLLLQRLPNNADEPWDEGREDIAWTRLQAQLADLSAAHLLDSVTDSSPEALLRNFVAIDDVTLAPATPLEFTCTCHREKTAQVLRTIPKAELLQLLEEQQQIEVTCEFCGQIYRYSALDTHLLVTPEQDLTQH